MLKYLQKVLFFTFLLWHDYTSLPQALDFLFISSNLQFTTTVQLKEMQYNCLFANTDMLRLTQLASIESHCIDSLPGPEHCVEPSCCNSNHCPSFQRLGENLCKILKGH